MVLTTYSHSRLSSFEDCPRKFKYRYVLKIPTDTEGIEGFVGKIVHDVLERLYIAARKGQIPSFPRVIARYHQLFDDAYDEQRIRIVRRENPLHFYRELGEHCLANYYHEHYPFDRDETISTEEHVVFELGRVDDQVVKIQGFIDRVSRAKDGAIEIHDYKTGKRVPSQPQIDQDRQLALYQMGMSKRFSQDQPFRLVWHFLQRGRTRTSTRSAGQLDDLRESTLDLIRQINTEKKFAPRATPLCSWCEFNQRCPGAPMRDPQLATWEETLPPPRPKQKQKGEAPALPADPGQLALPLG
jgi:putative RecB family exonuclease